MMPRYYTGNKVLIVAHPDDEILWFNPLEYDKIIIVFTGRHDRPDFEEKRKKAINQHPLRVECWGLMESNFWRDPSKYQEYEENYKEICEKLKTLKADCIDTHNAYGEYGHADHILVHNAVMDTVDCLVNGKDPKTYRKIKQLYVDEDVWTWK